MSRFISPVVPVFLLVLALNAPAQDRPAGPPAPPSGNVALVEGETISELQVVQATSQISRRPQAAPLSEPQLFQEAVDSLILQVLLGKEARDKGITVDPAKVEQAFKGVAAKFPSEEQFKKALEAQGMTAEGLRQSMAQNLVYQAVADRAVKDVPAAAEADIRKFYDGNPKYFVQPEEVRASHILLRTRADTAAEQKQQLKEKLEGIRNDVIAKKTTFAEAAAKFSEDPTNAQKGGDLGFFGRGRMVKPFDEAAFSAAPGVVTPVVETNFGYHIILVAEHRPPGQKPFEVVHDEIRNFLEGQAKQEVFNKYAAGLRAAAKVEMLMTAEEWSKRHPSPKKDPGPVTP